MARDDTKMMVTKPIYDVKDLPPLLSLLPLRGAVLLPRAQLPLPVLDSGHLSAIIEAFQGQQMLGLVQPSVIPSESGGELNFYSVGTAAQVIDINELGEDKWIVTLKGICRFDLIEEVENDSPLRTARVSYHKYENDLVQETDLNIDRVRLGRALKPYFKLLDVTPNWDEIEKTSNEKLINTLTLVCPLEPNEKQAVLESPTLKEQSQVMTTLIEMANCELNESEAITCH